MDAVPEDLLAPLTLVVGPEELLVSRAVAEVVGAARAADPASEVRDLPAADLQRGDLDDALSPSLFGGRRVVVVRDAQDLAKELVDELLAVARDVPDETSLVVLHAGGAKGKALVTALGKAGARTVEVPAIKWPSDRREFVKRELRRDGRQVEEGAVALLLDAIGTDLRELASAASQLLVDVDGPITADDVARYHRGRAEASGFAVADAAVEGELARALELARWGESTGLAPVLVTSALAGTLRSMAAVASAGGGSDAEVAAQVGMPAWKVKRSRQQVSRWRPAGLAHALQAVARADADVKGAAVHSSYAVERALVEVARARAMA